MTRTIIFDLDGTLIDSCAVCVTILETMIAERACNVTIDQVHARSFMSRGGEKMVAALLGDACRDPAADLAEFRERYRLTTTPVSAMFDGVEAGLRRLAAAGATMAICSNKPQNLCDKVLCDTGLADLFQVVVGGAAGLAPKPAPDLLIKTLAELDCPASSCVFVGDSELDHAVASAAGMPFYFLTHGYADPDWKARDCYPFDHFTQLVSALSKPDARAA